MAVTAKRPLVVKRMAVLLVAAGTDQASGLGMASQNWRRQGGVPRSRLNYSILYAKLSDLVGYEGKGSR
jgi:hypothetical protein